jgi:NAD(P)H dehydrogenase (quinone)
MCPARAAPAKQDPKAARGGKAAPVKGKGKGKAPVKEVVKEVIVEPPAPPMRVFLVIAHPEPSRRSFCHAIYRKAIETLKLNNHEVMTADLYESDSAQMPSLKDFNEADVDPSISYSEHQRRGLYNETVLSYQSRVEWCTHLVLFTPLFWLMPSAALMAWWEKVFGEGWAFTKGDIVDRGSMTGKKAMIAVTCGQEQRFYGKDSINLTIEELMYPITYRCFQRCGFTPLRTQAFFGLATAGPQLRVDMINAWAEHIMFLETREVIEFKGPPEDPGATGAFGEEDKVSNRKILAGLGDMVLVKPKDPYAFSFD